MKRKHIRKKVLKGGFYPSIYSGVSTASFLAPLAARQAYRLWNSRRNTSRKRKTLKRK
jgi:hypothetical protein